MKQNRNTSTSLTVGELINGTNPKGHKTLIEVLSLFTIPIFIYLYAVSPEYIERSGVLAVEAFAGIEKERLMEVARTLVGFWGAGGYFALLLWMLKGRIKPVENNKGE